MQKFKQKLNLKKHILINNLFKLLIHVYLFTIKDVLFLIRMFLAKKLKKSNIKDNY